MKRIAENLRSTREERFCSALVGLEHFRDKTVTEWIRAIAEGNVTGVQETFHLSCFQPDQNPTYYGHADSQLRRQLRRRLRKRSRGVSYISQANSYKNVP